MKNAIEEHRYAPIATQLTYILKLNTASYGYVVRRRRPLKNPAGDCTSEACPAGMWVLLVPLLMMGDGCHRSTTGKQPWLQWCAHWQIHALQHLWGDTVEFVNRWCSPPRTTLSSSITMIHCRHRHMPVQQTSPKPGPKKFNYLLPMEQLQDPSPDNISSTICLSVLQLEGGLLKFIN